MTWYLVKCIKCMINRVVVLS